ncbi:hypothetical protein V8J82_14730 [Gymnodinialimonas sp. 2305UL16-5]
MAIRLIATAILMSAAYFAGRAAAKQEAEAKDAPVSEAAADT